MNLQSLKNIVVFAELVINEAESRNVRSEFHQTFIKLARPRAPKSGDIRAAVLSGIEWQMEAIGGEDRVQSTGKQTNG